MPFIHPVIFWTGLTAVSVPIIIHLLNRRRFRIRDWAAMQFLLASIRKNRRRLRIEELLLLALRCLIILLLAVAVARFTGCEAMSILPGGASSQVVVFVLDDSYSMGQKLGAGNVLAAATADLAEQVKKLSATDRAAVILTSRPDELEAFSKLDYVDAESLALKLASLEPSDRRARLAEALAAADRIFRKAGGPKRLFVLSDFRRVDLTDAQQIEAMRKQFTAIRRREVEVIAMDYGREGKANLTVGAIELLDKFAVANVPARVGVTVGNNGTVRAQNVHVALKATLRTAGGFTEAPLPVQVIESVEPGGARRVELPVTPQQAGSAVVTAELPADELPGDNVAHLAIEVRQAIRVLVVDGRGDLADPTESESYFFVLSVDPNRDGSYRNRPDVIAPAALPGVDFNDYDLVVLMNVPDFPSAQEAGEITYPQLDALQKYVRQGGGLAIFTGNRVNLDFYNGPLYAGGAGLCPFTIRAPVRASDDPADLGKFYRLMPKSIAVDGFLQIFGAFRASGQDVSGMIRFFAFNPAEELAAPRGAADVKPPRVLARFSDPNHCPAVAARQYGRGTAVMFYTTGGVRWTDWPVDENGTYVAAMNDMLVQLARTTRQRFTARVGEPINFELPRELRDADAWLKTPRYPTEDLVPPGIKFDELAGRIRESADVLEAGRPAAAGTLRSAAKSARERIGQRDLVGVHLALERVQGELEKIQAPAAPLEELRARLAELLAGGAESLLAREFRYEPSRRGVYTITMKPPDGPGREVLFARNTDPAEGDLAPGHRAALAAALGSGDFTYVNRTEAGGAGAIRTRADKEYWIWAVAAVLALLALETFLGRRFGHYAT